MTFLCCSPRSSSLSECSPGSPVGQGWCWAQGGLCKEMSSSRRVLDVPGGRGRGTRCVKNTLSEEGACGEEGQMGGMAAREGAEEGDGRLRSPWEPLAEGLWGPKGVVS